MTQFDCLIKGHSNLSTVIELIGNHKIVMFPLRLRWTQLNNETKAGSDKLLVDKVGILLNNYNLPL